MERGITVQGILISASTSPQGPGGHVKTLSNIHKGSAGRKAQCCRQAGLPGWAEGIHGGRSSGATHRGTAFEKKPNPCVFLAGF